MRNTIAAYCLLLIMLWMMVLYFVANVTEPMEQEHAQHIKLISTQDLHHEQRMIDRKNQKSNSSIDNSATSAECLQDPFAKGC